MTFQYVQIDRSTLITSFLHNKYNNKTNLPQQLNNSITYKIKNKDNGSSNNNKNYDLTTK